MEGNGGYRKRPLRRRKLWGGGWRKEYCEWEVKNGGKKRVEGKKKIEKGAGGRKEGKREGGRHQRERERERERERDRQRERDTQTDREKKENDWKGFRLM